MRDDLYVKLNRRVERRLTTSARWGTAHALLFTIYTLPVTLVSIFLNGIGVIDGLLYASILGWSLLLFAHAGYLYLHSGARKGRRERIIQEEVLDIGDTYDLAEDDLIALHNQLDESVRLQAQPIKRLMLNAGANLLLWPGMLGGLLAAIVFFRVMGGIEVSSLARYMLALSMAGTFLVALGLPFSSLWQRRASEVQEDRLRAVYGYKRKRDRGAAYEDAAERLSVGDDGELIAEPQSFPDLKRGR